MMFYLCILKFEPVTALLPVVAAAGTRPFDIYSRTHYTAGLVKGLNDTDAPLCCLAAHARLVCAVSASAESVLTGHMINALLRGKFVQISLYIATAVQTG